MSDDTVAANAAPTPIDRRRALRLISGGAGAMLTVAPAVAVSATSNPDAEIIALSAEIVRRCAEGEHFHKTRIAPFEEPWRRIILDPSKPQAISWEEGRRYGQETGRDAAIEALENFDRGTDALFEHLMSMPTTTQPGRAAKVRAFLTHVAGNGWRGPADDLDWEIHWARAFLGEFAGMSADELAAV